MAGMDIVDRLKLLARGDNLDLVDIVCADAIAEIESLRKQWGEMAGKLLGQLQQNNEILRENTDRIEQLEQRRS